MIYSIKGTPLIKYFRPQIKNLRRVKAALIGLERQRGLRKLSLSLIQDPLTKLPNRYGLERKLAEVVLRASQYNKSALLFIDIDNFRLINDTLGHARGDEILVNLVEILLQCLPETDYLARLSGDSFAVLTEETNSGDITNKADNLRRKLSQKNLCNSFAGAELFLTVSIGIVMIDGTLDTQKLLSHADTALYAAKEEGKNKVICIFPDDHLMYRLSKTQEIINLIKRAFRDKLFVLHLQPIFTMEKVLIHYEALVRIKDVDGVIPPGAFIQVAERFGLMPQIDRWVVSEVLRIISECHDKKIFINISGASLGNDELLEFVEKAINVSGINPGRLGFEITETSVVSDLCRVERWLTRLRKIGCSFALDDFGVGFSSFAYLQNLSVDYLKIDGSFVRNLDKDPTQRALVQAMNAVAHSLGKETIAEYVENESILNILQELEIDHGQGFYLGKPEPV